MFPERDSIMSSATNILNRDRKKVLVTGKFEDYEQFNIGKYEFAESEKSKENPSLGRAFDNPEIEIPSLKARKPDRNIHSSNHKSQMQLKSEREALPSSNRKRPEMSEHDYVESGRNDLLVAPSRATPSEVTV